MEWVSALDHLPNRSDRILISWVTWHDSEPLYYVGTFTQFNGEMCARVDVSGQLQYIRLSDGEVYWMEIPPHPSSPRLKVLSNAAQRSFLQHILERQEAEAEETRRQLAEVR